MKTYRMNAFMAGLLYLLGTVFGVLSVVTGGEAFSAMISGKPLAGAEIMRLVAADPGRLTGGAFLILMMGISLTAMTIFLYPVLRKDSEELALGFLLFRGALEGTAYIIATVVYLILVLLGMAAADPTVNSSALQTIGGMVYQTQDRISPVLTIIFLIGATCLYISFYRTRLIPRWLSIWGLIGVVPYLAYALLHFFHVDCALGAFGDIPLAIQELVMGFWLVIRGFNREAVKQLDEIR